MRSNDRRATREQQFTAAIDAIAIAYSVLPAELPLPCLRLVHTFGDSSWPLGQLDEYEREEFIEQLERDHNLRGAMIVLKQLRPHLIDEAAKLGISANDATWPAIKRVIAGPEQSNRSWIDQESVAPAHTLTGLPRKGRRRRADNLTPILERGDALEKFKREHRKLSWEDIYADHDRWDAGPRTLQRERMIAKRIHEYEAELGKSFGQLRAGEHQQLKDIIAREFPSGKKQ